MNPPQRLGSLPPGLAGRLNGVCDRFEAQWLAGAVPRLEDFLPLVDAADRSALLCELLDLELHYRRRRGDHPTVNEYRQRLPEYGDLIASAFSEHSPSEEAETAHSLGSRLDPQPSTVDGAIPFTWGDLGPLARDAVAGFELLEVLGKGGMGVVYKARQIKLNRLVALKMILAGEHAGPEAVERFLAEARAVAKLSHPHIVQVYEIGESKGLPYIAMEFVAGGTLTKYWKQKPPAPAVAQLVETLAGAIHEAHQHGIIHRDLKPANILLSADGCPKIGDFGLAKHVGEEQQTATGAVMGTPSFMAPEQARGQSRDVAPATDVYALGAILYTGLTGQAPFVGATTIDILRQVIEDEPRSPRQLVPALPQDLDTICVKCLQKPAAERYVSAQALADDLRRFREGEPIHARSAGWGERLWKWGRRRPTRAALVCMTTLVSILAMVVILIGRTSEEAQRQAELQKQINDRSGEFSFALDANPADWDADHVRRLEDLEAELTRLTPDQDPALRKRLLDSALESAIRARRKQELTWEEEPPPVPDQMRILQRRNLPLFNAVADGWESRLVLSLTKPFPNAEALFPLQKFERGDHLIFKNTAKRPLVHTSVLCTGHVETEVELQHPKWDVLGPVGLVLEASQQGAQNRGFMFLLEVSSSSNEPDPAKNLTFADVLKKRGTVVVSIYRSIARHKQCLLQREVPITRLFHPRGTPGKQISTVRLRVQRSGNRLRFLCNDVDLVFEDAPPLTGKQPGVFALYLPDPLQVLTMRAWVKRGPTTRSELQEADELYAEEQFAEALTKYQGQIQSTSNSILRAEANYKKALCYLAMRDFDRASEHLTSLMTNPDSASERWRVLAMCQLWALRLKQGKEKEAEAIFRNLPRHDLDRLLAFVPDYLLDEIIMYYRWRLTGLGMGAMLHKGVQGREMALEIELLFQTSRANVLRARFLLFRAYFLTGQTNKAREQAAVMHRDAPLPDLTTESWWFDFWEEYSLMLRREKQGEQALVLLDKRLAAMKHAAGTDFLPLLIERGNLHFHLGRTQQAERDLDEFFRLATSEKIRSRFWTRACLMRGLLREGRDLMAAQEAWRLGLPKKDGKLAWVVDRGNPTALLHQVALAHRCDELSDAEVENLKEILLRNVTSQSDFKEFKEIIRTLLPEFTAERLGPVLRKSLDSQEGRVLIRQLAFQEVSQTEFLQAAFLLGFVDLIKTMLEPHALSMPEEILVRQLGTDIYNDALAGKITRKQIAKGSPLVFLWARQPGLAILGFDWPASAFDPRLRGPIAYGFGLRYLHVFRQPKEAATYFQRAFNLAPNGSTLKTLAANELERLNQK